MTHFEALMIVEHAPNNYGQRVNQRAQHFESPVFFKRGYHAQIKMASNFQFYYFLACG